MAWFLCSKLVRYTPATIEREREVVYSLFSGCDDALLAFESDSTAFFGDILVSPYYYILRCGEFGALPLVRERGSGAGANK